MVGALAAGIGEAGGDAAGVRQVTTPSAVARSTFVIVAPPARRSGFGAAEPTDAHAEALCAEARRVGREVVVVWCGHPANAPVLPGASLLVACWNPTSAMLRAAGRWLVRRV